jgi:hypothetical protein
MAKSPFVIPADIRRMLGPAPVLSTEDASRFEEMLTCFAKYHQPKNIMQWFWVYEQTVAGWNLGRLRGYVTHPQSGCTGDAHPLSLETRCGFRATIPP